MRTTRRIVIVAAMIGLPASVPREAAAQSSDSGGRIAVFRLHGPLEEAPPPFDFGLDMEPQRSLYGLLDRFGKAKKDDRLKAVVLIFDEPILGWGQRQELRRAILDLRASDKDVYCYLEEVDGGTYQVAAAGSRVYITPTGGISLMGLHVEEAYIKGLLDKIGVKADIEHIGDYKGAGEPFTRTGPSDEAKEMLDWLLRDLFDQMVQGIAEDRQITPDEARALIDRGPFTAHQAQEARLVDDVMYAEAFADSLKERYGRSVELVHNYGERELPEIDFSSPLAILKFFGEVMSTAKAGRRPSVAVVHVDGMIVTGKTEEGLFGDSGTVGSTTLRRVLSRAREDDSVKAVVLRVSSPGGSAVASDIIWHAAVELGEEKPLIVSMGDVAASGGYYVSAGAATIFADPGTITGSIGVVGGKLVTAGLWDWLGVTFHEMKLGENADLYNTNRPFDDRQRAIVRRQMQEVYDAFTNRVKEGRGDRLKGDLAKIAGGRVYTGRQAQANGLVDKLGGLSEAIKFAAAEAKISDYEIRLMPEPKNFLEMLFRGLTGEENDEDSGSIEISSRGWLPRTPAARELLGLLGRVDPVRARAVRQSLLRLEMLAEESVLLVMPADLIVR